MHRIAQAFGADEAESERAAGHHLQCCGEPHDRLLPLGHASAQAFALAVDQSDLGLRELDLGFGLLNACGDGGGFLRGTIRFGACLARGQFELLGTGTRLGEGLPCPAQDLTGLARVGIGRALLCYRLPTGDPGKCQNAGNEEKA